MKIWRLMLIRLHFKNNPLQQEILDGSCEGTSEKIFQYVFTERNDAVFTERNDAIKRRFAIAFA